MASTPNRPAAESAESTETCFECACEIYLEARDGRTNFCFVIERHYSEKADPLA